MFSTIEVAPIVRIPIPDSHYVTMAMDAGAQGVLAPYCETVAQVKEVVGAAKWRPLKGEAVERVIESGQHISDATRSYLEDRNKNSVCIIGIESVAAVNNLENILGVPGIDGIFVGPKTLVSPWASRTSTTARSTRTQSRGSSTPRPPEGLACWCTIRRRELSTYWIGQGARFILHGTDRRAPG